MKHLSNYTQENLTKNYQKHNAFFAFTQASFDEQKVDGVRYTNLYCGLICPSSNVKQLVTDVDKINADGIAQDLKDHGKERIIIRELYNYECFYTGDYSDVLASLKDYNITPEEIHRAFIKEYPNADL